MSLVERLSEQQRRRSARRRCRRTTRHWHAERPRQVRACHAQHQHADADGRESEQRADRHQLAQHVDRQQAADQAGAHARDHGARTGVWYSGCTWRGTRRQQAVARHRVEDARLASIITRITEVRPAIAPTITGIVSHSSSGCASSAVATGAALFELRVRHDAGQHGRHQHVEDRADDRGCRGCRSACRAADSSLPAPRSTRRRTRCRRRK